MVSIGQFLSIRKQGFPGIFAIDGKAIPMAGKFFCDRAPNATGSASDKGYFGLHGTGSPFWKMVKRKFILIPI
jgi:hypothetical protein